MKYTKEQRFQIYNLAKEIYHQIKALKPNKYSIEKDKQGGKK